jgi:ADP-ribose pyrophosphatase YjhB (NUDIX family)
MEWRRVHLCTGILEREGRLLLVASRYPNIAAGPLWNLPGGRQEPLETVDAAVAREFREETSLDVHVTRLAYVAESFDRATHTQFTNFAFHVSGDGEPRVPAGDAHSVDCAWVARADLAARIAVAVVREPLVHYLADPRRQYFGYLDAGITIEFAD